jgi:hypothetical protein
VSCKRCQGTGSTGYLVHVETGELPPFWAPLLWRGRWARFYRRYQFSMGIVCLDCNGTGAKTTWVRRLLHSWDHGLGR